MVVQASWVRAAPWDSGGALLAKDRRAPTGKGQVLGEKGTSHGFVSPHPLQAGTRTHSPSQGRACLGLTKSISGGFGSTARLAKAYSPREFTFDMEFQRGSVENKHKPTV